MKRKVYWGLIGLFAVLLMVPAEPAYAVIPAAVGPIQALIAIAPQLLAILGAGLVALLKPETYKTFFRYIWSHKLLSMAVVAGFVAVIYGIGLLFAGAVGKQKYGAAWPTHRGGADRLGSIPGQKGPFKTVKEAWSYAGKKSERVDSCPAVVGNRVYASSAVLSVIRKGTDATGAGTIYCRDADGGGVVWKYTGKGMDKGLTSVYSSPVIGGEFKSKKDDDGKPLQGRYLVVGEGYHQDINSRFFCLDLEDVDNPGDDPELAWYVQATSHVESTPCIYTPVGGDKPLTCVGAGDDGIWCLDLASGKVVWMVEGTPGYYLHVDLDPASAEKVKNLEGQVVAVTGTVERHGATMTDPGQVLFIKVDDVKPVTDPASVPINVGDGFRRTVVGKVVVGEQPTVEDGSPEKRKPLETSTGVAIEVLRYYLDVESAPVAVDFPKDPARPDGEKETRVFLGTGLGGKGGVVCLNGATGEEVWFSPLPEAVFTGPTVVGENVLVGYGKGDIINVAPNPEGAVVCVSAVDGKEKWRFKTGDIVIGSVAVKDDLVYAACGDRYLYVLNLEDGTEVKRILTGSRMVSSPAITDEAIYLTTGMGKVYCLDRKTYAKRWVRALTPGRAINGSAVAADDKLFVGTDGQGLFCLASDPDAATRPPRPWAGTGGGATRTGVADDVGLPAVEGKYAVTLWEKYQEAVPEGSPLAGCGGSLYLSVVGEDTKQRLACLEAKSGKEKWKVDLGAPATDLAVTEKRVYALVGEKWGREQSLVCLDAVNGGAELWREPPVVVSGSLALAGDRLFFYERTGDLVCMRASDRSRLWKKNLGGDISGAPAAAHGLVFAATRGGPPRLICLEDGAGQEIWSSTLPAEAVGAVATAGQRVFVACRTEDEKGRLLCLSLLDGGPLWSAKLESEPVGYPVASEDFVVVAQKDGHLMAFGTADGKLVRDEGYKAGAGVHPPAMVGGVLVYAAPKILGAWSLSAGKWPWKYRRYKVMGRPITPPVGIGGRIFIATDTRGLIALGVPEKPEEKDEETDKEAQQ